MTQQTRIGSAALVVGAGLLIAGCGGGPEAGPVPGLRSDMQAHFGEAITMRDAALFADLDLIREAGRGLAEAPSSPDLPAASAAYVEELRALAEDAASAADLDEGIALSAEIANACGSCHQTYDVGPRFVLGGAPASSSLATHMMGQAWVSRLLWDGLIAPSDELWEVGARELVITPPFPADMPDELDDPARLEAIRQRLVDLGEDALMAPESQTKSEILGEVWRVCAGCHGEVLRD